MMMINTQKLEKILKKRKDKIPALFECLSLTAQLCNVPLETFNSNFNLAMDKVENLLSLEAQSKKTCGYTLTASDYKALGIFQNHIKKHRKKSKRQAVLKDKLLRIMPKLYLIRKERNLNFTELQTYFEKKYKIKISRTYFINIFKSIN